MSGGAASSGDPRPADLPTAVLLHERDEHVAVVALPVRSHVLEVDRCRVAVDLDVQVPGKGGTAVIGGDDTSHPSWQPASIHPPTNVHGDPLEETAAAPTHKWGRMVGPCERT